MNQISLSSSVAEIFKCWPRVIELFTQYRMSCPGCYLSEFEELENALRIYGIPKEQFLESLQAIIENDFEKGKYP